MTDRRDKEHGAPHRPPGPSCRRGPPWAASAKRAQWRIGLGALLTIGLMVLSPVGAAQAQALAGTEAPASLSPVPADRQSDRQPVMPATMPTAAPSLRLPRSLDRVPRYIVYYNARVSPLAGVQPSDFSHVYLAFATVPATGGAAALTLDAPGNLAGQWAAVPLLQQAGKLVLLSLGGGTMTAEAWTRVAGREIELAGLVAQMVRDRGLDGVGIDFEISKAFEGGRDQPFDGRQMLIALTHALKVALPEGSLISHAPQSPYLSRHWHGGPYLDVLQAVGDEIDWIQVQYYNNPDFDSPVAHNLLGRIETPPDSSVAGLVAGAGGVAVPVEKIVVGKPIYHADASSGHMTPEKVRREILEPLMQDYPQGFGGLMGWQYADDTDDHTYWNSQMAPGTPLKR